MRIIFKTLGWLFAITAVVRSGLAIFTFWLAATRDSVAWDISLENLFTDHASFLNWVKSLGKMFLPNHFVDGIMSQPALVMLPLGALGAAILAFVFFRISRHR